MAVKIGQQLPKALAILCAYLVVGWFGGLVLSLIGEPTIDMGPVAIPKQLFLTVVLLIGATSLFEGKTIGLVAPQSPKSVALGWPIIVYVAVFALVIVLDGQSDPGLALSLLVTTALGSVSQELMFRGILLAGLRPHFSVMMTAGVTSLLSAVAWLPVWLWYGAWEQGIAEMVSGVCLGMMFSALRVRTGSLYPCIALHWALSYVLVLMRIGGAGVLLDPITLAMVHLPLAAWGIFLLRPKALGAAMPA